MHQPYNYQTIVSRLQSFLLSSKHKKIPFFIVLLKQCSYIQQPLVSISVFQEGSLTACVRTRAVELTNVKLREEIVHKRIYLYQRLHLFVCANGLFCRSFRWFCLHNLGILWNKSNEQTLHWRWLKGFHVTAA